MVAKAIMDQNVDINGFNAERDTAISIASAVISTARI